MDYIRLRASVARVLQEHGFLVTLCDPPVVSGPAEAPVYGAPVEHSIYALDDSTVVRQMFPTSGGGAIASDLIAERVVYLPADGTVEPVKGSKVRIAGVDEEVDRVQVYAPGAIAILYKVWLAQ